MSASAVVHQKGNDYKIPSLAIDRTSPRIEPGEGNEALDDLRPAPGKSDKLRRELCEAFGADLSLKAAFMRNLQGTRSLAFGSGDVVLGAQPACAASCRCIRNASLKPAYVHHKKEGRLCIISEDTKNPQNLATKVSLDLNSLSHLPNAGPTISLPVALRAKKPWPQPSSELWC